MIPVRCGILACAFAGCGAAADPTQVACEPGGSVTLQLGTGETEFVALQEDDDLWFFAGPQGGHHVYVSLHATGLEPGTGRLDAPDDPEVTIALSTDASSLSSFEQRPRVFLADGGAMALIGQLVVLDHADPSALHGVPAILAAEVEDRCGNHGAAEVDVVLQSADKTGT